MYAHSSFSTQFNQARVLDRFRRASETFFARRPDPMQGVEVSESTFDEWMRVHEAHSNQARDTLTLRVPRRG